MCQMCHIKTARPADGRNVNHGLYTPLLICRHTRGAGAPLSILQQFVDETKRTLQNVALDDRRVLSSVRQRFVYNVVRRRLTSARRLIGAISAKIEACSCGPISETDGRNLDREVAIVVRDVEAIQHARLKPAELKNTKTATKDYFERAAEKGYKRHADKVPRLLKAAHV